MLVDKNYESNCSKEGVSLLAIYGLGGAGMATVARSVCNIARVKGQLSTRIWFHVSQNRSVHDTLSGITESSIMRLGSASIIDCSSKKTAEYEAELISSYEEVCSLIPKIRSFGTLPKLKESVVYNRDLLLLAKEYLKNAMATMKLLAAHKLSLSEVRNRQAIIPQALKCYEVEKAHKSCKNYSQTLSKLKEFLEAEDPIAALLTNEFSSLCEQQQLVVTKLTFKKNEIRENLSSTKKWKKVCKVLYNAAVISVVVASVVLAAMSAPPFATVAAAAGCTIMKTTEQWFESIWANRLDALEGEKDVVLTMKKGEFGDHDLQTIRVMVKRLEIMTGSISGDTGFAIEHEEEDIAVATAMEEIMSKGGVIEKLIEGVEMKVDACDGELRKAVIEFLKVISEDL